MSSTIKKRSIIIRGHKTSISLEPEFWATLKYIAKTKGLTLSQLITDIDGKRTTDNLSSACRLHAFGSIVEIRSAA